MCGPQPGESRAATTFNLVLSSAAAARAAGTAHRRCTRDPDHRTSSEDMPMVLRIPTAGKLESKMAWRTIADVAVEVTLACAWLFGMILVAAPFLVILAAIITGIAAL